ncbi:hypothetical protein Plhal304r1_c097g0173911 [Plasmopara halstedii]
MHKSCQCSISFCACRVALHQWRLSPTFQQVYYWKFRLVYDCFPPLQSTLPYDNITPWNLCGYVTRTFVRSCVLRALQLHRNKRLYNIDVSTSQDFVRHHAFTQIKRHFRQFRLRAPLKGTLKWIKLTNEV